jgi:hypothetical protein
MSLEESILQERSEEVKKQLKVEAALNEIKANTPKVQVFELEPKGAPVSNTMDVEYLKTLIAAGFQPMEAVKLEKMNRIEQKRLFYTEVFPNILELTQVQQFELNRQIVILDACRITKVVKNREVNYLHCRVINRDAGLMHTSAALAIFSTDALYPLVDIQLSEHVQDITGIDFKEIEYQFERLEKPVIITGRILRKVDINEYHEDEEHTEKLATVVQLGVPSEKLPNDEVLPARGETKNDALKRYRAFIEAAGIEA